MCCIRFIFTCPLLLNLSDMNGINNTEMKEYHTKKKLASSLNRLKFLRECLMEQVLPKSAPQYLKNKSKTHPFGDSARKYLEEACTDLQNKIYELRDEVKGLPLPAELRTKLNDFNDSQKSRLNRKLRTLCENSPWKEVGNADIMTNLSTRQFSDDEKDALALGMKFDSGKDRSTYMEHVQRNYKSNEDDVEKGFIQGIILCCKALADSEPDKLPRRYMRALKSLPDDPSIVITPTDKGGGVVIINKTDYVTKMKELLNDNATYTKKSSGFVDKISKKFNKDARKLLRKTEKGKSCYIC